MKLTLGFSPCPNDTFIFDALVNNKIDTEGIEFDYTLQDVETLNQLALQGKLDVTKISFGVLPLAIPDYIVLNSGSALGKGVGPLLIADKLQTGLEPGNQIEDPGFVVALPGLHTTAHLLFNLSYPDLKQKAFLPFFEIEDYVLGKIADRQGRVPELRLGVIIHENRFTYEKKGLIRIADLGDFWETKTGYPIPLGGIVARREFDRGLHNKIERLIRRSLEYSYRNGPELSSFVKENAQEMEPEVMQQHIDLYVNEHSLELGSTGRAAIWKLLEISSFLFPTEMAGSFEVFVD